MQFISKKDISNISKYQKDNTIKIESDEMKN